MPYKVTLSQNIDNGKSYIDKMVKGKMYHFLVYQSSSGFWRSLIKDEENNKWKTFNDQYDSKAGAVMDLDSLLSLVM